MQAQYYGEGQAKHLITFSPQSASPRAMKNLRICAMIARLPVKFTSGFDPRELPDHFQRHGARLRITASASDYEERADAMFADPRPPEVLECLRPAGDVIRFNTSTDEYAVKGADNVIRTYYLPIPCRTLPRAARRPGNCHRDRTNLDYFQRNCRRRYGN